MEEVDANHLCYDTLQSLNSNLRKLLRSRRLQKREKLLLKISYHYYSHYNNWFKYFSISVIKSESLKYNFT